MIERTQEQVRERIRRQLKRICMPNQHRFGEWAVFNPQPPKPAVRVARYCKVCGKYEVENFVDLSLHYSDEEYKE